MEPQNRLFGITEEPASALLARVAYRLIELEWRRTRVDGRAGATIMASLGMRLHAEGFPTLATWVTTAAWECKRTGCKVATWRDTVVHRARQAQVNRNAGRPWRRVPPC